MSETERRVCADCGESVIPCFHTQSGQRGGWDHVTVADAGPCKGLCTALDTIAQVKA